MRSEKRHISSLTVDPDNLRIHPQRNIESIKASLTRFGQQKPIVITPEGIVVAGNGTVEAAASLGWTEVWVTTTKLDRNAQIEFAIADNRTQELSEWNYTALTETFKDKLSSEEWDLGDARELGFEPHELEPLLNAEWDLSDEEEDDEEDYDGPDDQHPSRTEFRNLVREVVAKVREELGDESLDERDALKHVYQRYLA